MRVREQERERENHYPVAVRGKGGERDKTRKREEKIIKNESVLLSLSIGGHQFANPFSGPVLIFSLFLPLTFLLQQIQRLNNSRGVSSPLLAGRINACDVRAASSRWSL